MLLAELLAKFGVEYIFGVPGGQTTALYNALAKRRDIKHIVMRDERNAVYAADGYARTTNKVGVCDATVGPGAVKLVSGLMEAYHQSIPIVAIISDLPVSWENYKFYGCASQAVDQLAILKTVTKAQFKVYSPQILPELVGSAFRVATSGRPGPVVLDIPHDVFDAKYDESFVNLDVNFEFGSYPWYRPVPDIKDARKAVNMLIEAEKPLIIAGGGARIAGAAEALLSLAEALRVPVATTFSGKGVFPENHSLACGVVGNMGTTCAKILLEEADVVFFIGFKSAQNSTFNWTLPQKGRKVIHLDIDPTEIGKVFKTDLAMVGDAKAGLELMLEVAKEQEKALPYSREIWLKRLNELKKEWLSLRQREEETAGSPVKPQKVFAELRRVCGADDFIVCDASFVSGWGAMYFDASNPNIIFPRGSAGLGYALPASIGVRLARKEGNVICVAGDGGYSYSLPELATLKQHGLKIISVILNNSSYAWIKYWQRIFFDENYCSVDLSEVNFAEVANGFGLLGIRVNNSEELREALERAISSSISAVVDVRTEVWETPIFAYREALSRLGERSS